MYFVHSNDQSECFKLLKTHQITNALQYFHLLSYLTLCQVQLNKETRLQYKPLEPNPVGNHRVRLVYLMNIY